MDPIRAIGEICSENGIWLHVDAAMAGSALILPEFQWMLDGREFIDSFVFNPHKWLFTNFDCSAYFVRDAVSLIKTFEILPEYLKTRTRGKVNDYRDWGVPLGRRFRAMKLWSVIRSYGVEELQNKLRYHIQTAARLSEMIAGEPDFEILAPVTICVVCFRYKPAGYDEKQINYLNEKLNHQLNDSGKLYLSHTVLEWQVYSQNGNCPDKCYNGTCRKSMVSYKRDCPQPQILTNYIRVLPMAIPNRSILSRNLNTGLFSPLVQAL